MGAKFQQHKTYWCKGKLNPADLLNLQQLQPAQAIAATKASNKRLHCTINELNQYCAKGTADNVYSNAVAKPSSSSAVSSETTLLLLGVESSSKQANAGTDFRRLT